MVDEKEPVKYEIILLGILFVTAIFGMLLMFHQTAVTGFAPLATCNDVCKDPRIYGTNTVTNCVKNCCAAGKLQCIQPAVPGVNPSTGMITPRRIKQVTTL